jgi:hypothetical protein
VRVLLDECVPRRLKRELVGHDAWTAPEMGWATKRNSELLRLAVGADFDVFLTVDRKLEHQQDLSTFDIAVLVLLAKSNTVAHLRPLMPQVLELLPTAPRGRATPVSVRGDKRLTID